MAICGEMFDKIENKDDYLNKIVFSNDATFHPSGKVNRHVRVWGTEYPHKIVEHVWDPPKRNVFWAVISVKVYGPFFFTEPTVTGISYLDMLENYIMPHQHQDMDRDFIFKQGGARPHFHHEVTFYLNRTVVAVIGHGRMIAWPPQSPDLTPLDFSLCGYIKDKCSVSPLPATLEELQAQVTEAVVTIDMDMIQRMWDEIAYRWDICCMT